MARYEARACMWEAAGTEFDPANAASFRQDPAVSSGAFVTTVMDVVGYGPFLGIATVWVWGGVRPKDWS